MDKNTEITDKSDLSVVLMVIPDSELREFTKWMADNRPSQLREALRTWRGQPEVKPQSCLDNPRWHCRGRQHCRCEACHDSGRHSLFPDLSERW